MTTKQIKALLTADLNRNIADLSEFNLLVKAAELNKWQLNKRILKHLPEGCTYNEQYRMYHVVFPSGNSHLLGWYGTTTGLSIEGLRHSDSCYSNGSENRIKQLSDLLQPENLVPFCKLFIALNKAVEAVTGAMNTIQAAKADSFYNPVYFDLLKMAGISQNAWFDMQKIKKEQSQS